MKIIVLAGGEGKRMWPINTDKCLIPFLGKSLLYHNLKKINARLPGVEFIIVASPQTKDGVEKVAEELKLDYKIVIQNEPSGMADAILSAKHLIAGEILIVNAEDILDASVFQNNYEGDVMLTGIKVDKYFPGGYIKVEGESVKGIVEKPGEGNEPSDMVKLVADYFKDGQKLIGYLEKAKSERDDIYEVALSQMISDGINIRLARYEGVWIPLKYPWHILDITAYFLSKLEQQISPAAKLSEKAIIEGNVVIEEGVKVFEGACIKGPCHIGKNCIVGNNSMIRESNLEEGCVTGFSSDITRSYIGANSWFHTNYIGDSVLEGDFGAGSGAVLANLRLDNQTIKVGEEKLDSEREKLGLIAGQGVRVGVNASTMPGVRVGGNSLIGPGVVLRKDLKEKRKITIKEESYQEQDYESAATTYDQFRDKLKH
ncbi:MAG: UDP-N-acetylglucosamine diphosphorylase/glucosamine-1-phosphate N-acetyltransferase GlmU [uncultured bacterium]|uniref:Bifunctional protein GlmU n=1 Tax=Candidatus Daviesbacteria bacterium GW2011_GWC2_40_12 TaxID=1618431 RepID=A0A0G0T581_9BACT|nr:MAG: UDP-N-acetylglucosamine diphosphorylase/glucosamine-1-phosphate N-acetyltransferase GlmU [uncultured bacterium]KKQ84331.1 MAG: Bifunctional protein GlmU [Candidatus Daviesbacteria bacterium GW2011_GWF2_38_7]KKR16357.1 MAG: Bifunctional protein GlmU [Candidatus Daviesbacteria bacterium GW2011_GWA2_39_33]KKR23476.1 MAG: Bifunctional protein GlmU [Candidatus Daviesbacteria bacterium GW2011_GWB1_39_5]KKR42270.1 MAG: Bifunctional protein GlmU [Candidatus Daviesbacteria bacterium GW2011_GWC2_